MNHISKITQASITNRILAMKFVGEFILIYPLYTIMFGERGHVSAAGIGFILAAGYILSVLFEVPTGIVADKIARKYVLVLSLTCKALGLLAWLLLPFIGGYLLGTALFALGTALESGALQAYLYGTLSTDSKKNFGKFWARLNSMVMLSYTLAYISASIIGVKYPILLLLSILSCVIAIGMCLTLPKDTIITKLGVKPRILASAFGHIAKSKSLIRLLMGSVIVIALADMMIEYSSLYYQQVGIVTRYVPLVFAVGNMAGAVLFWTLHSYEKALDKYKILLITLAILLLVASFGQSLLIVIVCFLVFSRFIRVLQIQFESNIQHLANDEARATITSIGAFISKIITAGTILLIGFSAHNSIIIRPFRTALVSGAALFIMVQLLYRIGDARFVSVK